MFDGLFYETISCITMDDAVALTELPIARKSDTQYYSQCRIAQKVQYNAIWGLPKSLVKNKTLKDMYYLQPELLYYNPSDTFFMLETDRYFGIFIKRDRKLWGCRLQSKKLTAFVLENIDKRWSSLPCTYVQEDGSGVYESYKYAIDIMLHWERRL